MDKLATYDMEVRHVSYSCCKTELCEKNYRRKSSLFDSHSHEIYRNENILQAKLVSSPHFSVLLTA